jgi:uncharacterized protein (DUF1778 family)
MACTSRKNPDGDSGERHKLEASERRKKYEVTINAKVTAETEAAIQAAAAARGLKRSEWLRQVVLDALNEDAGTRILLAELLAFRSAMLTMQKQSWRVDGFDDGRLAELVKAVDARKFALADARLMEAKR